MSKLCACGVSVNMASVGKYKQQGDILSTNKSRSEAPVLINLLSQCNHHGPLLRLIFLMIASRQQHPRHHNTVTKEYLCFSKSPV